MQASKLVIGEYYRHKSTPTYAWVKVLKILKPKQDENTHTYTVVKCEWSVNKDGSFGFIKYFKPSDLAKEMLC